jgi:hypothetical protein
MGMVCVQSSKRERLTLCNSVSQHASPKREQKHIASIYVGPLVRSDCALESAHTLGSGEKLAWNLVSIRSRMYHTHRSELNLLRFSGLKCQIAASLQLNSCALAQRYSPCASERLT